MGAFSFSVYSGYACTRASWECMERKCALFHAREAVSTTSTERKLKGRACCDRKGKGSPMDVKRLILALSDALL